VCCCGRDSGYLDERVENSPEALLQGLFSGLAITSDVCAAAEKE